MNVIEVNNVWEKYRIKFIREGRVSWEEIWALEDVNFKVVKGEVLGVIGQNGAGKTTLLKLIAGMLIPDRGTVNVYGKVSTLMELGAGFNPEFTGRENLELNARMYGLDEDILEGQMGKIIEFAGLAKFIDAPIKYYSQGMYMRLAFALAVFVEPDILLIDDILSVGDEEAQQKCINKIIELKQLGKTIILVTHNMNMVSNLCNRAILLEKGKIIKEGIPQKVIPYYLEKIEDYIREARQRIFLEQKVEIEKLRVQCTIYLGNFSLYADLENKAIRLYYKDKEITKGKGLYTAMYVGEEKMWLHSFDAQWQINKVSDKELFLTLDYALLYLKQIWRLRYSEDNTLENKIAMEADKQVSIINRDIRLEISQGYKDWQTPYEKGDFLVEQYINNIAPIRLKDSKVPKVILKSETNSHLPQLFFEISSQTNEQIFSIYKRKEGEEESICLNFSPIIPKKEALINPGSYTYFEGKVLLGKDIKLEEELVLANIIELNKGNLRFVFDRGRGRIFWEKRELTSGLSVYTSLRSSGIWYDSYQATWQINQEGNHKLIVSGDWPYIPISQIWQIELVDENSIFWQVNMEIYEGLNLEIEQTNIMLLSRYKTWLIPGVNKGEFINEYTQDYDILPFRFWYGKAGIRGVGATDDDLPCVMFKCNLKDGSFRTIIENSDYLYKARLLQHQKCNTTKLSPKKYTYFAGVIKIGP